MKATHRNVNGVRVELTPQESAKIEAEWEVENAKPPEPPPRDLLAELDDLKTRIKTLESRQPR